MNFTSASVTVCSKRCTASSDCPDTCCDASLNGGTFAVCAPRDVCVRGGIPAACLTCVQDKCADDFAACMADETCNACFKGDQYVNSPECRSNKVLTKGYACALRECPDACDQPK